MLKDQRYIYLVLFIFIVSILLIFFITVKNINNIENSKNSNLIPIKLSENSSMFIEPLIISTPNPSVLLSKRHGFVHAHRLNVNSINNNSEIKQKFSQKAIESRSIYYLMGVGEYKPSKPELPVDPRSFAPANIRNPIENSFDSNDITEIAEILTHDGKPPSHLKVPHDFIHLNYIGECDGKHLYYVLGVAKFQSPLLK